MATVGDAGPSSVSVQPADDLVASKAAITDGFAKVAHYVNTDGINRERKVCEFMLPEDLYKAADKTQN